MCIERSVSVCLSVHGTREDTHTHGCWDEEELGGQLIVSVSSRDAAEG